MSTSNVLTITDYSTAYKFVKDTPVYGGFMVWHLVLFMVLGPMLTWPMLMLLLLVFSTQTMKLVLGVRQETT
jgi:hypothetical protein